MAGKGKAVNRTSATSAKSGGRKPTTKSAERYDIQSFTNMIVSQAELASWLGITSAQVVSLWRQGVLKRANETSSDYNLKEAVRAYIIHCKARTKTNDKATLDMQLTRQRIENLKLKNRDYCISLGAEMASGILHGLADAMAKIKAELAKYPEAKKAIDRMLQAIEKQNAELIAKRDTLTAEDIEEKEDEE